MMLTRMRHFSYQSRTFFSSDISSYFRTPDDDFIIDIICANNFSFLRSSAARWNKT